MHWITSLCKITLWKGLFLTSVALIHKLHAVWNNSCAGGKGLQSNFQRTVFWSVSDLSYPNHIHVIEVAPLEVLPASILCGRTQSLVQMTQNIAEKNVSTQQNKQSIVWTAHSQRLSLNRDWDYHLPPYTTTCEYVTKAHRVREDHRSMMWSKASKWVFELRLFCYRYYFQRSGGKFFTQRRKLFAH